MEKDIKLIKKLCKEVLMIKDMNSIKISRLGGLTNKNYKLETGNENFVVRIPGEGTEELVNRKDEYICTDLANNLDIDSKVVYFEKDSGVKIARYIEEAETLNMKSIKNINNMKDVAETFKKLHTCDKTIPVKFNVFEKIEEYESLLRKCNGNFFWEDYKMTKENVISLKEEIEEMDIKTTMCHNDPLCENFVRGKDRMYLVDWEYAGMNDPMWDIADLFIEAEFTPEEEVLFNKFYFGQEPDENNKHRILMNKVFLDFLWSLWGMQRYSCGADLLDYANNRYKRAKKHLALLATN